MATLWGAVCFRSSSERAVTDVRDGPLRWTFETNGTDSSRRLLQKSVRAGRGSRPWTAGRDGPPGRTFETNGTDSWRRLLQKFVRAGRGRPAVTGRREGLLKQTARIPGADCCRSPSERAVGAGRGRPAVTGRRDGLLKQTARIPGADCCRSSSERAVDDRPWRAAGTDFWNKRHGFLAPIVADVRQSGPWTTGRDGPPEGLLKQTARIPGADCCRSPSERAVGAGRGRTSVTGRWDVLLKQTAQIPCADCFRIPSERAVDGLSWRAAGVYFWNKRHRFLAPIVSEFRQSGPWTACRDGPLGWTFETNGTASLCRLFQKSARSGRGRPVVTGRWDGLLKQTARILYAHCCKSPSERAVGSGRGRTAVTGCWDELLKQTARFPGADCFKSLSDRAVHVNQAAYHVYFPEPHWNSMGIPEITIW